MPPINTLSPGRRALPCALRQTECILHQALVIGVEQFSLEQDHVETIAGFGHQLPEARERPCPVTEGIQRQIGRKEPTSYQSKNHLDHIRPRHRLKPTVHAVDGGEDRERKHALPQRDAHDSLEGECP